MKKDLSEEIKKVSLRIGFLQNCSSEGYDEQKVVYEVLDVLAKYGLSIEKLKVLLEKQMAPKDALIKTSLAAEMLGVSVSWLQCAIQKGEFRDWARAIRASGNSYKYVILRKKFEDFCGFSADAYLKAKRQVQADQAQEQEFEQY